MNISRTLAAIIVAIILVLGLIFSVLIFTHYNKWNHYGGDFDDNYRQASINVIGIADKVFPADYIRVSGRIESNANKEKFINELLNKDISRDDINFTNNVFTIESEFVRNVEDFIKNKTLNQKLGLHFDKPEYFLKNIDDIRIKMLGAATKNAKAKAGAIVENGNGVLGSVIQSDMGKLNYYDQNSSKEFTNASELNPIEKRKRIRLVINQVYDVK